MIKKLITIALLSASFWGFNSFADPEAAAVVTRFHHGLISMMKTQGYEARRTLMEPIISENFDTRVVARVALGRNWKQLSNDDQNELAKLLKALLASSYADRFPSFSNQQFENGSSTPILPDRMIVESHLRTGSKLIELDYQLIKVDGQWKIFDVVAEGVSDLALKRGSFTETFRLKGLEGVIVEIEQSIIDYAKK